MEIPKNAAINAATTNRIGQDKEMPTKKEKKTKKKFNIKSLIWAIPYENVKNPDF